MKPKYIYKLPWINIVGVFLTIIFGFFISIPCFSPFFKTSCPTLFIFIPIAVALPIIVFIFSFIPIKINIFEDRIEYRTLTSRISKNWFEVELYYQTKGNALERSCYIRDRQTKKNYFALPVRRLKPEVIKFIENKLGSNLSSKTS